MSLKQVNCVQFKNVSEHAPQPIGHYHHLVELPNGMILMSGQKSWDPSSGNLVGNTIEAQTQLTLTNIEAILRGINLSLSDTIRLTCHLQSLEDYEKFNEVYKAALHPHVPARTVLAGYTLRGGALVEIVAEAFRSS